MNQTLRLFAGLFFLVWFFFLLFFSRKKQILTAVAFLCSTLLIVDAMQYAGSGEHPTKRTEKNATFTVYSQNILANSIKRGRYDLLETVNRLHPDVILLQEVSQVDGKVLLEKFQSIGYDGFCCVDVSPNDALGYAVFSKLPMRNVHAEILPGVDWSPVWPVQALEVLFQNKWIRCLNVHLMPPHHGEKGSFNLRPMQQRIAMEQIEVMLKYNENNSSPALICGDFNQTPTSKILDKLEGEFVDSWKESGSGLGFSWNTRRPLFRIDYMWHNDKIIAIESKIVSNNYSDHFGIFTGFKLNTE